MKVFFQAFVNFETNYRTKDLLVAKFFYNNTQNASLSYTLFEVNYNYYLYNLF